MTSNTLKTRSKEAALHFNERRAQGKEITPGQVAFFFPGFEFGTAARVARRINDVIGEVEVENVLKAIADARS